MPDKIQLNLPFILIIVILFAAVAIGYYFYRRTNPEVKPWIKYVLSIIRITIIFSLLLLLFAPSLLLTYYETEKPRIGIFIDNSRSMGIHSEREQRWKDAKTATEKLRTQFPPEESTEWFQFNSRVEPMTGDSLRLSSAGTNFKAVQDKISAGQYDLAVILSDGNNTEGNYYFDKTVSLASELVTVGIGDIAGAGDVFIDDIIYQPVAYKGQMQQINVQIGSKDVPAGTLLKAELKNSDQVIQSKTIRTDTSGTVQPLTFEYTPQKTGLNKLKIETDVLPNEDNTLNNTRTIIQDVLKNKLNVAVISSLPGYESKFLHQIIGADPNFECKLLIEDRGGKFLNEAAAAELDSLDAVILQDYPVAGSSRLNLDRITSLISRQGIAVICFLGGRVKPDLLARITPAFSELEKFPDRKPAYVENYIPSDVSGSTLLRLFDTDDWNRQFWSKIPPVQVYFTDPVMNPEYTVLVSAGFRNRQIPVLFLSDQMNQRCCVFNAEGFWRWHFELQGEGQLSQGYARLLSNILRWVTGSKRLKPVMLEASTRISRPGETIKLTGIIYDAEFQPMRNGSLQLNVMQEGQNYSIAALFDSVSGQYQAGFTTSMEGNYLIRGEGTLNGKPVGDDEIELEVVPFEKEYIRTAQNVRFLKELAESTQGFYLPAQHIDSLRQKLDLQEKTIERQESIELWFKPFMLILVVSLITLEWLFRKRVGLI